MTIQKLITILGSIGQLLVALMAVRDAICIAESTIDEGDIKDV